MLKNAQLWEPSHTEEGLDGNVAQQEIMNRNGACSGTDVVLAVDIGATKIAFGLITERGDVIAEHREPYPGNVESALARLRTATRELLATHLGDHELAAVGIACGGPLDLARGMVLSPPNLPDWDEVPVTAILAQEYHVPTFLMNDATAGALSTLMWDNAENAQSIVYLTVSSGIGCGVILGGEPVLGQNGNATELGHTSLQYGGRLCGCGLRGCAEAYISGTSIGDRFAEKVQAEDAKSDLTKLVTSQPRISAAKVASMAEQGHPLALAHWQESMLMLRRLLRNALEIYAPDLLVLGGGVTQAPPELFNPALAVGMDGAPLTYPTGDIAVIRTTNFQNQSGVLSAAAIAWHALAHGGEENQ